MQLAQLYLEQENNVLWPGPTSYKRIVSEHKIQFRYHVRLKVRHITYGL